jgi:hypothetical protein
MMETPREYVPPEKCIRAAQNRQPAGQHDWPVTSLRRREPNVEKGYSFRIHLCVRHYRDAENLFRRRGIPGTKTASTTFCHIGARFVTFGL